jgi:hypothetical protein
MLLINAVGSGYCLLSGVGDRLSGAKASLSALDWILVGIGCFCVVATAGGGWTLFRTVASIHRYLAVSRIALVSVLAFVCGAALAGAAIWLRASEFKLSAQFENPNVGRVLFFLIFLSVGWLISMALAPLLLNRRSLQ